jgi:hypothetical protein
MNEEIETRLRAVADLLPEPGEEATSKGRRAMHAALRAAPRPGRPPLAWLRTRTRRTYLLAAALAVIVAGGALAAIRLGPRLDTAPDTPAGAAAARGHLGALAEHTPTLPGEDHANFVPIPATARAVFSARTRYGEYTIWRARTKGARGRATVYSSPRMGISSSHGVEVRLPRGPYVQMTGGGASPVLHARELFGRASASVRKIEVVLKDGSRREAILRHGWLLFTQDFGHPPPVRLLGRDRHGRVVATSRRSLF